MGNFIRFFGLLCTCLLALANVEQLPAHQGAWTPVLAEPVVVDGKLTVTLGMDGRNRFFRLRKP
jgi:hypothetical protein